MNELLLEAFRHNAWATDRLLAACRGLPEDQLRTPGRGTYGSVLDTFNHLIQADMWYVSRRGVDRPAWAESEEDTADLDELESRAAQTAQRWERYLSEPVDPKKLLVLDQGAYEAEASVLIVQALHHGNVHREQICSILTEFGIEPPNVQAWAYAEATGHARERTL